MLMIFTFAIAIPSVLAMTKIHATKILFIMNFVHAQALISTPLSINELLLECQKIKYIRLSTASVSHPVCLGILK